VWHLAGLTCDHNRPLPFWPSLFVLALSPWNKTDVNVGNVVGRVRGEGGGGEMGLWRSTPTMVHNSAGVIGVTSDEASHNARGFGCKARRWWKAALVVASSFLEGGMSVESSVSNSASSPPNTTVASGPWRLPSDRR
jgi:hypothetical protein